MQTEFEKILTLKQYNYFFYAKKQKKIIFFIFPKRIQKIVSIKTVQLLVLSNIKLKFYIKKFFYISLHNNFFLNLQTEFEKILTLKQYNYFFYAKKTKKKIIFFIFPKRIQKIVLIKTVQLLVLSNIKLKFY